MSINLSGPIVGARTYINGPDKPDARDVTFTLPNVDFIEAEYKAGGKISLATSLIEAMESSITHVGLNESLPKFTALEAKDIEHRFAQDVLQIDGTKKTVGGKVFLRCSPKNIPGGALEMGTTWEGELKFGVTSYQLFVGGVEFYNINPLNGKLVIGGVDYMEKINSLL
jgi:P2 family phage contractile tail tube protein